MHFVFPVLYLDYIYIYKNRWFRTLKPNHYDIFWRSTTKQAEHFFASNRDDADNTKKS